MAKKTACGAAATPMRAIARFAAHPALLLLLHLLLAVSVSAVSGPPPSSSCSASSPPRSVALEATTLSALSANGGVQLQVFAPDELPACTVDGAIAYSGDGGADDVLLRNLRMCISGDWVPFASTSLSCGDGNVDAAAGEECDDGDTEDNDGCSSTCKDEVCGDGIQQTSEECDDNNTANNDGCSSTCKNEVCGDGIQQTNEECDDGNTSNGDSCASDCSFDLRFHFDANDASSLTLSSGGTILDSLTDPESGISFPATTANKAVKVASWRNGKAAFRFAASPYAATASANQIWTTGNKATTRLCVFEYVNHVEWSDIFGSANLASPTTLGTAWRLSRSSIQANFMHVMNSADNPVGMPIPGLGEQLIVAISTENDAYRLRYASDIGQGLFTGALSQGAGRSPSHQRFYLGSGAFNEHLDGHIAEIKVWDVALSPAQLDFEFDVLATKYGFPTST